MSKPHAMLPQPTHDERERQAFVTTLRGHLASQLMPGNYALYERRVEPAFIRQKSRKPAHYAELRPAMEREHFYQFWSAMQRCSQQRMWDAVIDSVERELPRLISQVPTAPQLGTLRLDPELPMPKYHTMADIHLQPGGYHGEFTANDVAAGAIYDAALTIYSNGGMGPRNEYLGELLLGWFREHYPRRKPQHILDMGCAIGNSTLPWGRAFPNAQLAAIDVAAPQLRYGHARAETLGVAVHFSQQNAERTDFPDGSFDLVLSHIMLHETSRPALPRILAECRRLLKPGGLMLHLEIPRGDSVLENFLYNWESWNNNEIFGHHMTHIDLAAIAREAGFDADSVSCHDHAVERSREQQLYTTETRWKILAATAPQRATKSASG